MRIRIRMCVFYFDAISDPDPAFHSDADPDSDPASQNNVDLDPLNRVFNTHIVTAFSSINGFDEP